MVDNSWGGVNKTEAGPGEGSKQFGDGAGLIQYCYRAVTVL